MFYKVVNQFGPRDGEAWVKYLEFSKLYQITDFCSFDSILNNDVFTPSTEEDWNNCINENFKINIITNLAYARRIQSKNSNSRIFGVIIDPSVNKAYGDDLLGFDIIDGFCSNSLLTNCGGFPDIFNTDMINQYGLLNDIKSAYEIRDRLRAKYHNDSHAAECEVWAVFNIRD